MRDINPDGALPLFIGGGDHEVVRGCKNAPHGITPNYSLLTTHLKSHPLTAKAVPSPYKQGESAVRSKTPHGLLTTLYSLLSTYYLPLTIFCENL